MGSADIKPWGEKSLEYLWTTVSTVPGDSMEGVDFETGLTGHGRESVFIYLFILVLGWARDLALTRQVLELLSWIPGPGICILSEIEKHGKISFSFYLIHVFIYFTKVSLYFNRAWAVAQRTVYRREPHYTKTSPWEDSKPNPHGLTHNIRTQQNRTTPWTLLL